MQSFKLPTNLTLKASEHGNPCYQYSYLYALGLIVSSIIIIIRLLKDGGQEDRS